MYTSFAEVYDGLMAGVDYESWARFYAQMLAQRGVTGGKICECACGTGGLTLPLQRLGYSVTGVDISQEMLWIAAQKARSSGVMAVFVRQDMRRLRLHRPMDAVLATCDGVNYLTSEEDLTGFFSSAREALSPNGCLIFDVSTPYKLANTLGNRTICEDTPGVTYMWQNRWQPRSRCVDMHLCIFVREEDGRYRRMDEEQRQRAWSQAELTDTLTKCGFTDIVFYGNSRLRAPRDSEERWHVSCVRKEEENSHAI